MSTPLHVLVVEDRPAAAALVIAEIEAAGFAPTWRHVADPAAYLIAVAEQPQLIIVGDAAPPLDPRGALRLLREQEYDIPVIVISGVGEDAGLAALRDGAEDYLLRDRLARLGPAIDRALAQRRMQSERRRVQRLARLHEQRYRAAFDNAPVGMVLTTAHGYVLDVNAAFSQLTGWGADQLRAGDLADLVDPPDRWQVAADRPASAAAPVPEGGSSGRRALRLLRPGGAPIGVRYSAVLVDDVPDGQTRSAGRHVLHLFTPVAVGHETDTLGDTGVLEPEAVLVAVAASHVR